MARLLPIQPSNSGGTAPRLASWVWQFRPRAIVVPIGASGIDLVSGRPPFAQISTVNTPRANTVLGPVWRPTGFNNGGGLRFIPETPMDGTRFTAVIVGCLRSAGENSLGRLFTGLNRDVYPSTSGRLEFTCSFTNGAQAQTFAMPWDGSNHRVVIGHDASNPANDIVVFTDGKRDLSVSQSQSSSGTYNGYGTGATLSVGNNYSNNARCLDGDLALAAFFDAVLPQNLAQAISRDHRLLFAP